MPSWPTTLPQVVLQEGYDESPPDTTIRTPMEVGPPKIRRRATANTRPINARLRLSKAQVDALDAFYVTTLQGGALQFSWWLQRNAGNVLTRSAAYFRFRGPPKYGQPNGGWYSVDLPLEIMP